MRERQFRHDSHLDDPSHSDAASGPAPGRETLTEDLPPRGGMFQGKDGKGSGDQAAAASGFSGPTMDIPYRSEMEHGFGTSFSGVQAYGGGAAAKANESLGSEAYAVGQQVAFKTTSPSKEVVAHELAHTIQQSGGAGAPQTWTVGSPGDSYEQEADHAAHAVLSGERANVSMRASSGGSIQRWGGSDHYTIGNTAGQKALAKFAAQFPGKDPGTPKTTVATSAAGKDGATSGLGVQQGNKDGTISASEHGNQTMGIQTGAGTVSFGAASRFGGDYTTTVGGLHGLGNETGASEAGGAKGWVSEKVQFAQMAIGASTNSNHFYPQNGMEYHGHHAKAVGLASQAHAAAADKTKSAALMQQAMEEEGFGNHFLQDTHSSGHMAPRALDSIEAMHNDRHTVQSVIAAKSGDTGIMATLRNAAGKGIGAVADKLPSFVKMSAEGLMKSHQWHDYFCALPNGLPTTLGRFHGDYLMDGNDLQIVSETCSNSIMEVLAAAQGQSFNGNVETPRPDFNAIMADPMAGPAWRMMMADYKADLAAAKAEIRDTDTGHTDGGTTFKSKDVTNAIEQDVFGGNVNNTGTPAKQSSASDPSVALNQARKDFQGILDSVKYYSIATFEENANLGAGVNDDLKHHENLEAHFDCNDLENKMHLYSQMTSTANAYKAQLTTAMKDTTHFAKNDIARMKTELDLCTKAAASATAWTALATANVVKRKVMGGVKRDVVVAAISNYDSTIHAGGEFHIQKAAAPQAAHK